MIAYTGAPECDVRDVLIAELTKQRDELIELLERISKQEPERPDYWSTCGQCERNISDAEDAVASVKGSKA